MNFEVLCLYIFTFSAKMQPSAARTEIKIEKNFGEYFDSKSPNVFLASSLCIHQHIVAVHHFNILLSLEDMYNLVSFSSNFSQISRDY